MKDAERLYNPCKAALARSGVEGLMHFIDMYVIGCTIHHCSIHAENHSSVCLTCSPFEVSFLVISDFGALALAL